MLEDIEKEAAQIRAERCNQDERIVQAEAQIQQAISEQDELLTSCKQRQHSEMEVEDNEENEYP